MIGNRFASYFLLLTIAAFTFARFYNLDSVPYGFYVDEGAASIEALCIADEGRASYIRERLPVFFRSSTSGTHSPTWVYTASLWSVLFGSSISSFRALSACAILLTIAGTYLLGRELFGERAGRFALLCGTISPWAFQYSRVAWDSAFFPMFTVWAVFCMIRARDDRPALAALSGLLFSLAAYSYAAGRLTSILLFLFVWIFRRVSGRSDRTVVARAATVFACSSLAIVTNHLNGVLSARVKQLSVLNVYQQEGLLPTVKLVASSYLSHLSPSFLFIRGDTHNLRHTTHHFGMLSWIDGLGFLVLLIWLGIYFIRRRTSGRQEPGAAAVLVIAASLIAIIPAALTVDDMPHGLRSSGAWPFVVLGAGQGLALLTSWRPRSLYLVAVLTIGFSACYLHTYFTKYAISSASFFDGKTLDRAKAAMRSGDWSKVHDQTHEALNRYYLMAYGGRSCEQSLNEWLQGKTRPEQRLIYAHAFPPLFVQLALIALCLPLATLTLRREARKEDTEAGRGRTGTQSRNDS